MKATTEALIVAAQEQAIRTNYVKFHIDRTVSPSLCRMCSQKRETVLHLVSGCSKSAQGEYKDRHDNVGRKVHWELCGKNNLAQANKWHKHQPQGVFIIVIIVHNSHNSDNIHHKLLSNFSIQCYHEIEHLRPDLIIVNKEKKTACIIDVAVPGDNRVVTKKLEKIF